MKVVPSKCKPQELPSPFETNTAVLDGDEFDTPNRSLISDDVSKLTDVPPFKEIIFDPP